MVLSKLYTYDQVAEMLSVPISVIHRAIESGELPFVECQDRRRIEAKAVETLIERHRKRNTYHYNKTPDGFEWSEDMYVAFINRRRVKLVDRFGEDVSFEFKGVAVC